MRGIYKFSEWIAKFAVVNILWLLTNTPILLILLNGTVMESQGIHLLSGLAIACLTPFLFVPSSVAMFATVRDWIVNKEGQSTSKTYFVYFKKNYKKSMLVGFPLTLAWVIALGDIYYFMNINTVLMFTFTALSAVLFIYTINLFSVMAHYELNIWQLIKKALFFTFASPALSIIIILSSALIIFVSMTSLRFMLPFFTAALIAFISFSAFYKAYERFTRKLELSEQK